MITNKVPKMFYDDVIVGFDRLIDKFQKESDKAEKRLEQLADPGVFPKVEEGQDPIVAKMIAEKRLSDVSTEFDMRIADMRRRRAIHLDHSKCFFIDSLLEDSFLNMPYNPNQNWEHYRLPFPFTFFELQDAVELNVGGLVGYDMNVKGITLARYSTIEKTGAEILRIGQGEASKKDVFEMTLHHANTMDGFDSLSFDVNSLPQFIFAGQQKFLSVNPEEGETGIIDMTGKKGVDTRPISSKLFAPPPEDLTLGYDDEHTALSQMVTFCVNAINCINAQNVYYKKVKRLSDKDQTKLKNQNKKRVARGRVPFIPVRPYYLIQVQKKIYLDDEEKEGKSWELDHRVWVRAHNRHYQDGRISRIEAHVRGPPDAPWKYNRYANLYKKYRHLLKNSRYK